MENILSVVQADIVVDCTDLLIAPGFIDLQINGAFGVDFSTVPNDLDQISLDLDRVAKGLLQFGVTSFCPTIITSPADTYPFIFPRVRIPI